MTSKKCIRGLPYVRHLTRGPEREADKSRPHQGDKSRSVPDCAVSATRGARSIRDGVSHPPHPAETLSSGTPMSSSTGLEPGYTDATRVAF
jgi:hypothetical protein